MTHMTDAFSDLLASSKNSSTAVGSIQLQFFRKYPGLGEESADAASRAPNFEEAPRWIDLKHQDNTFQQFGFPEFEIWLVLFYSDTRSH